MDVPTPDPPERPFIEWLLRRFRIKTSLRFRVDIVIFIAILWKGCEIWNVQETTLHEEGNSSWILVPLYGDRYTIHGADLDTCLQWARFIEAYLTNNIIGFLTKKNWQKKIVLYVLF